MYFLKLSRELANPTPREAVTLYTSTHILPFFRESADTLLGRNSPGIISSYPISSIRKTIFYWYPTFTYQIRFWKWNQKIKEQGEGCGPR